MSSRKSKPALPPVPDPPSGLSERALYLWGSVVPARARSAGRLAVIEEALRALDRADAARVALDAEGMVSKTESTGALHVHPLVKVERENRALFVRLWQDLGLAFQQDLDATTRTWL